MNAPVRIDDTAAQHEPASMLLTWKVRANPEKRQRRALERITEGLRQLHNAALEERIECYRKTGKTLTDIDQSRSLTEIRAFDPEFARIPRRSQRETLARLQRAFSAFYKRAKAGAGAASGFPQFKSRERFNGFGFDAFQQIRLAGNGLRFDGMPGKLRLDFERPLPPTLLFTIRKGKIDFKPGDAFSVIVTDAGGGSRAIEAHADRANEGDGRLALTDAGYRGPVANGTWRLVCRAKNDKGGIVFDLFTPEGALLDRASVGMAYDNVKSVWFVRRDEWNPKTKRASEIWYCGLVVRVPLRRDRQGMGKAPVGVDWGTSVLAALSTGETVPNARPQERRLKALRRAQRAVARKKPGSKGRRLARAELQHLQRTIAAERRRRMNKLTKRLVTHFGLVAIEDLDVKGLMNAERPGETLPGFVKRRRNREALDAAPHMLRQMVEYKAPLYGAALRKSDPKHTSAQCLWCGSYHFKELTETEHVCTRPGPFYGRREPRKVHAAKVILSRGLQGIPSPADGSGGGLVPEALNGAIVPLASETPRAGNRPRDSARAILAPQPVLERRCANDVRNSAVGPEPMPKIIPRQSVPRKRRVHGRTGGPEDATAAARARPTPETVP